MACTMEEESIRSVKVCVIGESGVGKSALALRFTSDIYTKEQVTTIGAALLIGRLTVGDETLKFMIWDTAGQERFSNVVPMFYRNAEAAIIVYDITSRDSFNNVRKWYDRTQSTENKKFRTYILCGNKCDLEGDREVSSDEGRAVAESINAKFFETSALASVNVNKIFHAIAADIVTTTKMSLTPQGPVLSRSSMATASTSSSKRKKCCN